MGMDLLDITFRIEKTFDINLSHDDFDKLVRDRDIFVGDLYDFILSRMHLRDVARSDIRVNYELWSEMQQVLHSATDVPLDSIELRTPLQALFLRETRRAKWSTFRDVCPYRIRELDYPRAVRIVGLSLALGVVLIEQLPIWQLPAVLWFWPLLGLLGLWMVGETYLKLLSMCAPLRNSFPSGMATVKDLCRAVLATNYEKICRSVEAPLDDRCLEVWRQLMEILVDTLGVDSRAVTFRSRLIRDLGMA